MKDDETRILILEDNPTDAELVEHELRKGGVVFQSKRVETRDDFISQIEEFTPQVILADYKLPTFDGMTAFTIIKGKGLEVPFIIVSGTLGEDLAVETLKAGVTDYILKSNLNRLVPAVNRALAETELHIQRRQAEEALRERESQFKKLSYHVPGMIYQFMKRPDGTYCLPFATEAIKDIFGCSPQDVREDFSPIARVILPEDFDKVLGSIEYSAKHLTVWECEYRVQIPGQSIRWMLGQSTPEKLADGSVIWYGFNTDITERKQTELKLRDALTEAQHFRRALDYVSAYIYMKDSQSRYVYANQPTLELFGCSAEELFGCDDNRFFPPNTVKRLHEVDSRVFAGEQTAEEIDVADAKGGRRVYWEIKTPIYAEPECKTIWGLLGISTDITERKQTEEALRESEELYRLLIENINLGITLMGTDYRILMTNTGQAKLFNKPASGFRGKQCFREFKKRSEVCSHCPGTIAMSTGRTAETETTGIRDDGSRFSVHIHAFPTFGLNGEISGFVEVVEDITERNQADEQKLSLQAQLRQSQKMEAIGQLAGGVAHDFNNLLTVISVQTQLGLRGLREGDPLKERLKDIELSADRAADLTRQLLAFSRRQILEMKVFNLNFILKDMEKMLRRVIGEDIELKSLLADDLGLVKVDPGQMEQVIVNLAVNAKDAMPEGGKLLLETANAELDEEYVHSHVGMIPGAYVLLSITDTGVGMSKEVKEQIFDPFFTTKEKGKGTGLGLSTVYGIVKQSGGDIYVDSEPNKGTTFKVYLPRVFEPQEELKKVSAEEIPRGKETIVVVEDDRMVRKLAVDILRKQGYRVLEAEAGGEGLLICEQYKEPVHLILTDVIMPKMSGSQFIERLRQVRKDFKVLYMTGYTDEAILRHGIREEGIVLIHKPFTIEKLAKKVREVLDS